MNDLFRRSQNRHKKLLQESLLKTSEKKLETTDPMLKKRPLITDSERCNF